MRSTRILVTLSVLAFAAWAVAVYAAPTGAACTGALCQNATGDVYVDTGGNVRNQQAEWTPGPANTILPTSKYVTGGKYFAVKASPGFATTCCLTFDGQAAVTTAAGVQGCVLGIPIQGAGDSFAFDAQGPVTVIQAACTAATASGAALQLLSGK